jgi:hypothetical protein
LVSVGYEGQHIDEFVNDPVRKEVEILAAVRLTPLSRKPGVSKSRLRDRLEVGGIDCRHLRALGNPKDDRAPFHDVRAPPPAGSTGCHLG